MPQQRVKGQESFLTIVRDGVLEARIDSIKEMTVTLDIDITDEEYLSETANRFDEVFKGVSFSAKAHMANGQAIRLAEAITRRARRFVNVRIDIATTLVFPSGELLTIELPDVKMGSFPLSIGSRSDYVSIDLEGKTSDFNIV